MINNIELEIINEFVNKRKQERLIYELGNSKKREHIMLNRFAGSEIFKKSCLQVTALKTLEKIHKELVRLSNADKIYFMGETYIGEMSLIQAIEKANNGEICIIYCGNGIGYYQGEQEIGSPPRFFLKAE